MTPDAAPLPPTWTSPVLAGIGAVAVASAALLATEPLLLSLLAVPALLAGYRAGWGGACRALLQSAAPVGEDVSPDAVVIAPHRDRAPRQWVDEAAVLERMGGSIDILMELTALFTDENQRRMPALRAAMAAGDALQISREAHGIKSGLTNFCADDAVAIAFHIEKTAKEGDIDGLPAAIDRLDIALTEVTEQLTAMGRAA